jgi:hypothetical protein
MWNKCKYATIGFQDRFDVADFISAVCRGVSTILKGVPRPTADLITLYVMRAARDAHHEDYVLGPARHFRTGAQVREKIFYVRAHTRSLTLL